MSWYLPPGSEPADLADRLLAHGFTHSSTGIGMATPLDHLPVEALPAGVTIERIADHAALRMWVLVSVQNFSGEAGDPPAALIEPLAQIFAADGLGAHARTCLYLASLDGTPVATALVIYAGGAAGIYAVTTAPTARRRGIGRAVTLAALLAASARGYRIAVLMASEMGASLYRRLGFEDYCVIAEYLWLDDTGVVIPGEYDGVARAGHAE